MTKLHDCLPFLLVGAMLGACDDPKHDAPTTPPPSGPDRPRVRQKVSVGDRLTRLSLSRIERTSEDLVTRARKLASLVSRHQDSSGRETKIAAAPSQTWAASALESRFTTTIDTPFPSQPSLVVEYLPHSDWLVVQSSDARLPGVPTPSSEPAARRTAWRILKTLRSRGLCNPGEYGVVGAGTTTAVSNSDSIPFTANYIFQFSQFVDGFAVTDSSVEVRLTPDLSIQMIGVRQINMDRIGVTRAQRGSRAVMAGIRRATGAKLRAVGAEPPLTAAFSEPIPAYQLPDTLDHGTVLPRLIVRGAASNEDHVTKGFLMAAGFRATDTPEQVFPPRKPLLCRGFEAVDYIDAEHGTAIVARELIHRLFETPSAFELCEEARLYPVGDENDAVLVGVDEAGLLGSLGFVEGDRRIVVCTDDDPNEQHCRLLTDKASFNEALVAFAGTAAFKVHVFRENVGFTNFRVQLEVE